MLCKEPKKIINTNKLKYISDYFLDAETSLNKSIQGLGKSVHKHITNNIQRLVQYYRTFAPSNPESIIEDFKDIFDRATIYLRRYSPILKKQPDFLAGIKVIYDFIEEITKEPEQIKTPNDIVGRGKGGFIVRRKDASDVIGKVFHVSANRSREDSVTHTGTWWVLLENGTYKLLKAIRHDAGKNTYSGGKNAGQIEVELQKKYEIQGIYKPEETVEELPKCFDKSFIKPLKEEVKKVKIEYPEICNYPKHLFDQSSKQSKSNSNSKKYSSTDTAVRDNSNKNDDTSEESADDNIDYNLDYSGVRALFGEEESDSESYETDISEENGNNNIDYNPDYSGVKALFGEEESDSESYETDISEESGNNNIDYNLDYSGVKALFGEEESDSESYETDISEESGNNNIDYNLDYSGVKALFGEEESDSESYETDISEESDNNNIDGSSDYSGFRALFCEEESDLESYEADTSDDEEIQNNPENNNKNIPINTASKNEENNNDPINRIVKYKDNYKRSIDPLASILIFPKNSNVKAIKDNLNIDVKENLKNDYSNIESTYKFDIANLRLVNNVVNLLRAFKNCYINEDVSNSEYYKDFIINIVSIGTILYPTPLTIAGSLAVEFILNDNDLSKPTLSLANTIALNIALIHPIGEFAVTMVKYSLGAQALKNVYDFITIDPIELYDYIFSSENIKEEFISEENTAENSTYEGSIEQEISDNERFNKVNDLSSFNQKEEMPENIEIIRDNIDNNSVTDITGEIHFNNVTGL